jgi:glycosyltransferase involved in cell wall biosynthesis
VLDTAVSLVGAADVEAGARAAGRPYDTERLQLLTVGRIDAEKNPLLLPEVLSLLREREPRWRLIVCGEGDLADALMARVEQLGLAEHCEVRGYVPLDGGLLDLYRASHAFLHVSRTEGLPQVLIEAYASGLPSVATAVGGVRALGDCSLLVPPDDAVAAAGAVQRLIDDRALRERLVVAGLRRAERATLEAQAAEVVRFIAQ